MLAVVGVILYFLLALLYGWLASKTVAYSTATQFWGQRLANSRIVLASLYEDPDLNGTIKKANLYGFQKQLTIRKQALKEKLCFLGNIPFFIIGATFFPWYVPISGLLIILNCKYYFLNQITNNNSFIPIILNDLRTELNELKTRKKTTAVEIKEREFFILQLNVLYNANYDSQNTSIFSFKEIE